MTPTPTSRAAACGLVTFMLAGALAGCDGTAVSGTAAGKALPDEGRLHFTQLGADQTGIDAIMTSGQTPSTQILEVNGSGLALLDFDGDGDLDLFVANGATMADPEHGPGSRLYENQGELRFRDVTAEAGIDLDRWAMGVAVADYDGDGRDDLYVACFGPDVLLHNDGGRFTDVTESAGLGDPRWGTSAAFGDIDRDGDLDLYVAHYLEFDPAALPANSQFKGVEVMAGPHGLQAIHDVLYENLGDGTFRDATAARSCLPAMPCYALGVAILDFNGDGWQDIFVGNDSQPNFLFRNRGDGTFVEVGSASGIATDGDGGEQATMGIGIADVDGNARPDVFTTVFSSDNNTLHLNMDGEFFEDRTARYGLGMVSRTFLGWSCGFYDFDHDGDEDLLIVNGHVYPQATMASMDSDYEQVPLLFAREGDRFERVAGRDAGDFLDQPRRDRAAAFGDLDGDGDVDALVGELNGGVRLLRNDRDGGSWISVALRDERKGSRNRRGIGAVVQIAYRDQVARRWIYSGGYQSVSSLVAHFGLPAGVSQVAIEVTWPDGLVQRFPQVGPKRTFAVVRTEKEERD